MLQPELAHAAASSGGTRAARLHPHCSVAHCAVHTTVELGVRLALHSCRAPFLACLGAPDSGVTSPAPMHAMQHGVVPALCGIATRSADNWPLLLAAAGAVDALCACNPAAAKLCAEAGVAGAGESNPTPCLYTHSHPHPHTYPNLSLHPPPHSPPSSRFPRPPCSPPPYPTAPT